MLVKELMTTDVHTVNADAAVREAAEEMAAINVGALPVARDRKLVGMITDRDIAIRVVATGLDPDTTRVGDVMTREACAVSAEQEVVDAAHMMEDKQIRRAPVMDSSHRLVGIVSLGDLALKCGDETLTAEVLREVSAPVTSRTPGRA